MDEPSFDLLDPPFVAVIIGLLLEGRCRLLHLGPPCSRFSMACNRCRKTAMRTHKRPQGLLKLKPIPKEKVRMGNALGDVATHLGTAQERVKQFWTFEQPDSSIMWIYMTVADFMAKYMVIRPVTCVCAFGAPWQKATAVAANFPQLATLARKCRC